MKGAYQWPRVRQQACSKEGAACPIHSGTRPSGSCSGRRWSTRISRAAADQAARAGRAVTGRDLLVRLRHRRDPHRAAAAGGAGGVHLILPMTLVILFVMVLVLLSYREIVMVYIRPGGSYVVARENFGPRIAQVCAVALLIDYIVTVAVQTAAGTAAVARPSLDRPVQARDHRGRGRADGVRQPARHPGGGRAFAVPTYLFAARSL